MNRHIVFAVLLLLLVACVDAHAQVICKGSSPVNETVERKHGQLQVTLAYSSAQGGGHMPEARRQRSLAIPNFQWLEKAVETKVPMTKPTLLIREEVNSANFVAPTLRYLDFKGRGLSTAEKQQAANSKRALFMSMDIPRNEFEKDFTAANRFIGALAKATDAFVIDDGTREVFSAASWLAARASEPTDLLSISKHVTVHAFRSGDYVRAVTVGMSKFGLPDLSVPELAVSETQPVGYLINALAQRMFESPFVVRAGYSTLQFAELKPTNERRVLNERVSATGTGKAGICLYEAKLQEGDAENRQFEIGFDGAQGPDKHARRHAFLNNVFGLAKTEVLGARAGDNELEDASRRAREKLPQLKREFNTGLRPGERLLVKAPFPADDGSREFMWAEIVRWSTTGGIRGVLMSDPRAIRALRAGQEITMSESDFYDYLRVYADGRDEGNETGKILQRRSAAK